MSPPFLIFGGSSGWFVGVVMVGGPLDTSEKIAMHAGAREHELSSDAEDAAQCVMRVTSVHKRKVARRPSSHAQTDSTEAQQSPHVDAHTLRCSALRRGRVAPRRTQRRRFGRRHPRGTAFGSSVASRCCCRCCWEAPAAERTLPGLQLCSFSAHPIQLCSVYCTVRAPVASAVPCRDR